jgi:hypothetical protein
MAVPRLAQSSRPFALSLRIRHPAMDPAEISTTLGLEAVHAFKAGQSRSAPTPVSGQAAAHPLHTESYWLGSLDFLSDASTRLAVGHSLLGRVQAAYAAQRSRAYSDLGLALNLFLLAVARTHEPFLRRVQTEGGQVTLIVEVTGSLASFSITPGMSRLLDKAGIAIEFDFGDG